MRFILRCDYRSSTASLERDKQIEMYFNGTVSEKRDRRRNSGGFFLYCCCCFSATTFTRTKLTQNVDKCVYESICILWILVSTGTKEAINPQYYNLARFTRHLHYHPPYTHTQETGGGSSHKHHLPLRPLLLRICIDFSFGIKC